MKNQNALSRSLCALAFAGAFLAGPAVSAIAGGYDITINTGSLIGSPASPFSLDFQLNDGAGTGSNLNFAGISNFSFGGGSVSGAPTALGGAVGDLASGITITTTSAFNELYQGFTPGSTLSFHVSLSEQVQAGGTPDSFSISILNGSLGNISTTGVADTMLQIDITGAGAVVNLGDSIDPAGVSIAFAAVPEPYAAPTAAVTLLAAFAGIRRWKASRRA